MRICKDSPFPLSIGALRKRNPDLKSVSAHCRVLVRTSYLHIKSLSLFGTDGGDNSSGYSLVRVHRVRVVARPSHVEREKEDSLFPSSVRPALTSYFKFSLSPPPSPYCTSTRTDGRTVPPSALFSTYPPTLSPDSFSSSSLAETES